MRKPVQKIIKMNYPTVKLAGYPEIFGKVLLASSPGQAPRYSGARIKLILLSVAILFSLQFYFPTQSPAIKNVFAQEAGECVDGYIFAGYDENGDPQWTDEECGYEEPRVDPVQTGPDETAGGNDDPCGGYYNDDGSCGSSEGAPFQNPIYEEIPCYFIEGTSKGYEETGQYCDINLKVCPYYDEEGNYQEDYFNSYSSCVAPPSEPELQPGPQGGVDVVDPCRDYNKCTRASYCASTIGDDGTPQPTCVLYDQSLGQGYISDPDAQCKQEAEERPDRFYCDGSTCFEVSSTWNGESESCEATYIQPQNCPISCESNQTTPGQNTLPEDLQQTIQAGGVNIDTSQIRQRCEEAASLNPDYYDRCLQEEAANQILTLSANDIDRGNCSQEQIDSCSSNGFACGDGKCFFKQHDVCSDVIDLPDSAEKDVLVKACKQLDAQPQDKLEQINEQLRALSPDAVCKEKKASEFYCDGPACIQKSSGWDGNACVDVFASTGSDNCPDSCRDNKDISGQVLNKIDCSFYKTEDERTKCEAENKNIEEYQTRIDRAIVDAGMEDCNKYQQDVSKERCYRDNQKVLEVLKRYNALNCNYVESCPDGGYKACQGAYSEDGTCRYKENGAGCSKCQEKAPDVFSKDAYCNEEGRCVNGPGAACINDKQCLKPYLAGSDEAGARCVFNEKGTDGKFKTCVGKIEKDPDGFARCKFDTDALSCSEATDKEPDILKNSIPGENQNRCSEEGKCLNGPGYVCTGDDECRKQIDVLKERNKQFAGASCPKPKEEAGKVSLCYGVISPEGVCELKEDSECSRAVDKKDYDPESDKAYCDNGVCKDGPGKACKVDSQCYFSKAPTEGQECRQTQLCDLADGSQGEQVCKGVGSGKICDLSQGGGSCSQCQPKGTVRLNKEATCDPSGACVGAPAISGCMSRSDCPQPAPVVIPGVRAGVGQVEINGFIFNVLKECKIERQIYTDSIFQASESDDRQASFIDLPNAYKNVEVCVTKNIPTGTRVQPAQIKTALSEITKYDILSRDAITTNSRFLDVVRDEQASMASYRANEAENNLAIQKLLEAQRAIGIKDNSDGNIAGRLITLTDPNSPFRGDELERRQNVDQASLYFTANISEAAKARDRLNRAIASQNDDEIIRTSGEYDAAVNKAQASITTLANLRGESGTGTSQAYQNSLDQLPTREDERFKDTQAVNTNTALANNLAYTKDQEVIRISEQVLRKNADDLAARGGYLSNGTSRAELADQLRWNTVQAVFSAQSNLLANELIKPEDQRDGRTVVVASNNLSRLIDETGLASPEQGQRLQNEAEAIRPFVEAQRIAAQTKEDLLRGALLASQSGGAEEGFRLAEDISTLFAKAEAEKGKLRENVEDACSLSRQKCDILSRSLGTTDVDQFIDKVKNDAVKYADLELELGKLLPRIASAAQTERYLDSSDTIEVFDRAARITSELGKINPNLATIATARVTQALEFGEQKKTENAQASTQFRFNEALGKEVERYSGLIPPSEDDTLDNKTSARRIIETLPANDPRKDKFESELGRVQEVGQSLKDSRDRMAQNYTEAGKIVGEAERGQYTTQEEKDEALARAQSFLSQARTEFKSQLEYLSTLPIASRIPIFEKLAGEANTFELTAGTAIKERTQEAIAERQKQDSEAAWNPWVQADEMGRSVVQAFNCFTQPGFALLNRETCSNTNTGTASLITSTPQLSSVVGRAIENGNTSTDFSVSSAIVTSIPGIGNWAAENGWVKPNLSPAEKAQIALSEAEKAGDYRTGLDTIGLSQRTGGLFGLGGNTYDPNGPGVQRRIEDTAVKAGILPPDYQEKIAAGKMTEEEKAAALNYNNWTDLQKKAFFGFITVSDPNPIKGFLEVFPALTPIFGANDRNEISRQICYEKYSLICDFKPESPLTFNYTGSGLISDQSVTRKSLDFTPDEAAKADALLAKTFPNFTPATAEEFSSYTSALGGCAFDSYQQTRSQNCREYVKGKLGMDDESLKRLEQTYDAYAYAAEYARGNTDVGQLTEKYRRELITAQQEALINTTVSVPLIVATGGVSGGLLRAGINLVGADIITDSPFLIAQGLRAAGRLGGGAVDFFTNIGRRGESAVPPSVITVTPADVIDPVLTAPGGTTPGSSLAFPTPQTADPALAVARQNVIDAQASVAGFIDNYSGEELLDPRIAGRFAAAQDELAQAEVNLAAVERSVNPTTKPTSIEAIEVERSKTVLAEAEQKAREAGEKAAQEYNSAQKAVNEYEENLARQNWLNSQRQKAVENGDDFGVGEIDKELEKVKSKLPGLKEKADPYYGAENDKLTAREEQIKAENAARRAERDLKLAEAEKDPEIAVEAVRVRAKIEEKTPELETAQADLRAAQIRSEEVRARVDRLQAAYDGDSWLEWARGTIDRTRSDRKTVLDIAKAENSKAAEDLATAKARADSIERELDREINALDKASAGRGSSPVEPAPAPAVPPETTTTAVTGGPGIFERIRNVWDDFWAPSQQKAPTASLTENQAEIKSSAQSIASDDHPTNNQDAIVFNPAKPQNGAVFDGVSTGDGGPVARLAATNFRTVLDSIPDSIPEKDLDGWLQKMKAGLDQVSKDAQSAYPGKASTGTIVKIVETESGQVALVAHVGDSRAIIYRNGTVIPLTEEARGFARNFLADYIGNPKINVQTKIQKLEQGDLVIITSDGIHDNLTDDAIINTIKKSQKNNGNLATDLSIAARDEARAYEAGSPTLKNPNGTPYAKGSDDISVVVMNVKSTTKPAPDIPKVEAPKTPGTVKPAETADKTAPEAGTAAKPESEVPTSPAVPQAKLEELPLEERISALQAKVAEAENAVSQAPQSIAKAEITRDEAFKELDKLRRFTRGNDLENSLGQFEDFIFSGISEDYRQALGKLQNAEQTLDQQRAIINNAEKTQNKIRDELVAAQKVRDANPTKDNIDKLIQEAEGKVRDETLKLRKIEGGRLGEVLEAIGDKVPERIKNMIPGREKNKELISLQMAEIDKADAYLEALKTEREYLSKFGEEPKIETPGSTGQRSVSTEPGPIPPGQTIYQNPLVNEDIQKVREAEAAFDDATNRGTDIAQARKNLATAKTNLENTLTAEFRGLDPEIEAVEITSKVTDRPDLTLNIRYSDGSLKTGENYNSFFNKLNTAPKDPATKPLTKSSDKATQRNAVLARQGALNIDKTIQTLDIDTASGTFKVVFNDGKTVEGPLVALQGAIVRTAMVGDETLIKALAETVSVTSGKVATPREFVDHVQAQMIDPNYNKFLGKKFPAVSESVYKEAGLSVSAVITDQKLSNEYFITSGRAKANISELASQGIQVGLPEREINDSLRQARDFVRWYADGDLTAGRPETFQALYANLLNGGIDRSFGTYNREDLMTLTFGSILEHKSNVAALAAVRDLSTRQIKGLAMFVENAGVRPKGSSDFRALLDHLLDNGKYYVPTNPSAIATKRYTENRVVGQAFVDFPGKPVVLLPRECLAAGTKTCTHELTHVLQNMSTREQSLEYALFEFIGTGSDKRVIEGLAYIVDEGGAEYVAWRAAQLAGDRSFKIGEESGYRDLTGRIIRVEDALQSKAVAGSYALSKEQAQATLLDGLATHDYDKIYEVLGRGNRDEGVKVFKGTILKPWDEIGESQEAFFARHEADIISLASETRTGTGCITYLPQAPSSILDLFIKPAFAANPCPVTDLLKTATGIEELPRPVANVAGGADNIINSTAASLNRIFGGEDKILSQNQRAIAMANTEGGNLFYLYPNGELGTAARNIGETPIFIRTEEVGGRVVPTGMTIPDSLPTERVSQLRRSLEDYRGEPLPDTAVKVQPESYMEGIARQTESKAKLDELVSQGVKIDSILSIPDPVARQQLIDVEYARVNSILDSQKTGISPISGKPFDKVVNQAKSAEERVGVMVEYITGYEAKDTAGLRGKLLGDQARIRSEYGLPERDLRSADPEKYLAGLKQLADENDIKILRKQDAPEYLSSLKENTIAAAFYDEASNAIYLTDISDQALIKDLPTLEHELIHGLDYKTKPNISIEETEYRAYVANITDRLTDDQMFGYLDLGLLGSTNTAYRESYPGIKPLWKEKKPPDFPSEGTIKTKPISSSPCPISQAPSTLAQANSNVLGVQIAQVSSPCKLTAGQRSDLDTIVKDKDIKITIVEPEGKLPRVTLEFPSGGKTEFLAQDILNYPELIVGLNPGKPSYYQIKPGNELASLNYFRSHIQSLESRAEELSQFYPEAKVKADQASKAVRAKNQELYALRAEADRLAQLAKNNPSPANFLKANEAAGKAAAFNMEVIPFRHEYRFAAANVEYTEKAIKQIAIEIPNARRSLVEAEAADKAWRERSLPIKIRDEISQRLDTFSSTARGKAASYWNDFIGTRLDNIKKGIAVLNGERVAGLNLELIRGERYHPLSKYPPEVQSQTKLAAVTLQAQGFQANSKELQDWILAKWLSRGTSIDDITAKAKLIDEVMEELDELFQLDNALTTSDILRKSPKSQEVITALKYDSVFAPGFYKDPNTRVKLTSSEEGKKDLKFLMLDALLTRDANIEKIKPAIEYSKEVLIKLRDFAVSNGADPVSFRNIDQLSNPNQFHLVPLRLYRNDTKIEAAGVYMNSTDRNILIDSSEGTYPVCTHECVHALFDQDLPLLAADTELAKLLNSPGKNNSRKLMEGLTEWITIRAYAISEDGILLDKSLSESQPWVYANQVRAIDRLRDLIAESQPGLVPEDKILRADALLIEAGLSGNTDKVFASLSQNPKAKDAIEQGAIKVKELMDPVSEPYSSDIMRISDNPNKVIQVSSLVAGTGALFAGAYAIENYIIPLGYSLFKLLTF